VAGPHSGEVKLLIGFAPVRPGDFQAYLITHRAAGSTVRATTVNRVATHGWRGEEAVELAILKELMA
jgi:hypothetical protein